MRSRRAGLKVAPLPKIFSSGLKRTLVPRRFLVAPRLLSLPSGAPRREVHGVELLAARDLHLQLLGERVDDGDADAVQAAGGVVDLAVELAARVQRGHDDFEGGLVLELGVRVDGDAAAVVGDGQEAVLLDAHLDPGGVAGHGLVHGVVDHLGEQVMQRLLVGAADVHAGPAPHGLQAFQHLDVGGRVAVGAVGGLADGANHFLFRLLLRHVRCVRACRTGFLHTSASGGAAPAARAASCSACSFVTACSPLPGLDSSDLPNRSRKAPKRKAGMGF